MLAVIPTVRAQLLAGVREIRLGSSHPKPDFTSVDETVSGFLKLASMFTEQGSVLQLGRGTAVSVGEVVSLAREINGSSVDLASQEERIRPVLREVQVLLSDSSGARLGSAGN
jgi:nucleoside-diphosphate-sugar epimerase